MTTTHRAGRTAVRALSLAGAAVLAASVLAACGGGSGGTDASAETPGTSTEQTSSSQTPSDTQPAETTESETEGTQDTTETTPADDLAAALAKVEQPLDAYPVPSTSPGDVSSLSGRTLYYIPITSQSPQFAVTQEALTEAAATVGMKVQACDGKGTPTEVSACITQGTDAKAGAIITDAVSYVIASNAFDAAQAAGIPVIISNQVPDDRYPASATLAYMPVGGPDMSVALAQWVTQDSGGTAHVLINKSTDGPSPAAFVAAAQQEYTTICPDCAITLNEVSSSNFALIPSSTSAALLSDPSIDYVDSQFGQYLQATQGGVQQAGRIDAVKMVTGAGQLGEMQALASDGLVYAVASQAAAYQGWIDLDAAMRLMLGTSLPDYTIPIRLFTRDTIKDVALTAEAQQSGEWFGPATFTDDFKTLWGVA